jgi:hypothetical protein
MSFSEIRVLKQVAILPALNAVNVQWANQVLKQGVVISETFERKAYTADQAADFAAEVEGAASYMAALGWSA